MDMLPPQAPPASIQHANQAARDTLKRLTDAQGWIAQQQGELAEPPFDALGDLTQHLDDFRITPVSGEPGEPALTRRQAFARQLAQIARDDASLRASDGTFKPEARDAVFALARAPGDRERHHLVASELLVAGKPYAGALIVEDAGHAGQVLFFSTQGGWEAFTSLPDLYASTLGRLGQILFTRDDLPGLIGDIAGTGDVLSARPITGDIFDTLANRLIQHLAEKAEHAWRYQDEPAGFRDDRLREALDLHALVDVHSIVAHRDIALLNAMTEARLRAVPASVRDGWLQAAQGYDLAQANDAWRRHDGGVATRLSLAAFAQRELTSRLADLGIAADPTAIRLKLASVPDSPLTFLVHGRDTRELSLLELAFVNASCTQDHITVLDDGTGAGAALSAEAACAMVRRLDLGPTYLRYLVEAKGPSMLAQEDRALSGTLLLARMRFEAADARLSYYNANEPSSFLVPSGDGEVSEQGYAWVTHVLDHPSPYARPTIDGIRLQVEQVTYQGHAVNEVVLISAVSADASPRVVAYLPDAPGRTVFREFANRAEFERQVLLDTTFETYLADRLPLAFSHVSSNGTRRFTLSYGAELRYKLSGDTRCGFCTRLEEPFRYQPVTTSFVEEVYFSQVDTAIQDTRALTRGTARVDDDVAGASWRFLDIGDELMYAVAKALVLTVPHAAQAAWQFEDHVKNRDYREAFLSAVAGYHSALNLVPLYSSLPRFIAGTMVRGARGTESVASALRPSTTLFDKRFVARELKLPGGSVPTDGVYTVDGARYIQHGQKFYKVRYDDAAGAWRLTRDGAPHASAHGPLVERIGGLWQFRRTGLLGGKTDLFAEWMHALPGLAPDVRTLSFPQYASLRARLADRLDPMVAARVYRAYGLNRPTSSTPITPTQRQAWHDAVSHARGIARDADVPLSSRVLAPRSPDASRARPFTLDAATDEVLQQLRQSAVPQLADFSAVEFQLLANRLNNHLGAEAAARVFRSLGVATPAPGGATVSLTERTLWRDAVTWVHSLRPAGSPPIPAFLD